MSPNNLISFISNYLWGHHITHTIWVTTHNKQIQNNIALSASILPKLFSVNFQHIFSSYVDDIRENCLPTANSTMIQMFEETIFLQVSFDVVDLHLVSACRESTNIYIYNSNTSTTTLLSEICIIFSYP